MPKRPHGRPTPQALPDEVQERPGPRFQDVPAEAFKRPDANPYLLSHREHGLPLLPADQAWPLKGRWDEHFGGPAPLHVEIGSGNGFFLAGMAARHPDQHWIGIEIRYKRTVLCAKKIEAARATTNARIVRYHAAFLDDLFEEGSLDGLHVNHPDPWPKERHEKNRLISRWFLEDVVRLLKPGGVFRLKSDHKPNVDRLVHVLDHGPDDEPLPPLPLRIVTPITDVHAVADFHWADGEPDLETNYQSKFRKRGEPVYVVEVVRA